MKKVVFGGFCMLTAILGIFTTLYTETSFESFFVFFCCLGACGLLIGVWGVFENDNK